MTLENISPNTGAASQGPEASNPIGRVRGTNGSEKNGVHELALRPERALAPVIEAQNKLLRVSRFCAHHYLDQGRISNLNREEITEEQVELALDFAAACQEFLSPAQPGETQIVLAQLWVTMRRHGGMEGQALGAYLADLETFPTGVVALACAEARREEDWFPSIACLRGKCKAIADTWRLQRRRAMRLAGIARIPMDDRRYMDSRELIQEADAAL